MEYKLFPAYPPLGKVRKPHVCPRVLSSTHKYDIIARESGVLILLDSNQPSPVSKGVGIQASQNLFGRAARMVYHCTTQLRLIKKSRCDQLHTWLIFP